MDKYNTKDSLVDYKNVDSQGLNVNRAINNKWIGYIPIENALGKKFNNLELDLTRFTIPSINVGTATSSFRGISVELPTRVINPSTREISFEYFVSEDWYNYRALYHWASGLGIINPATKVEYENVAQGNAATGLENDLINCQVWLLNNYKKKILSFTFYNCFIKSFSDLALDYSQTEIVRHSFRMAYSHFTIDDV